MPKPGNGIKRKLQVDIHHEYRYKIPHQNSSELNPVTNERDYTLWPSGTYPSNRVGSTYVISRRNTQY